MLQPTGPRYGLRKDLAGIAQASESTVDRWIRAEHFRTVKAGRKVLIDLDSAEGWLRSLPSAGTRLAA